MTQESFKSLQEIESMRAGGRILAEVLDAVELTVKPGVTSAELNDVAYRELTQRNAKPAFLGYNGFPASLCVSINDEIVHGIPGERVVSEGDLVGLDLGVTYEGMITDGARTVRVGQITPDAERLLAATQGALAAGIAKVKAGRRMGDVSEAIQHHLEQAGLSVIEDLSGHGVGREVHEEPMVPNFGRAGKGPKLVAGMTLAIEPMASLGDKHIGVDSDGWTIRTVDGSLAAQFEHTVLVTNDGAEILTQT